MNSFIKTNPLVLRDLIQRMAKKGCEVCGMKIDASRLSYIEQLDHPHILKYRILCDEHGSHLKGQSTLNNLTEFLAGVKSGLILAHKAYEYLDIVHIFEDAYGHNVLDIPKELYDPIVTDLHQEMGISERGEFCIICQRWYAKGDLRKEIVRKLLRAYMLYHYGNCVIITDVIPEGVSHRAILGVRYHPKWGHPTYNQLGMIWIGGDFQVMHSRTTTRRQLNKSLWIAMQGEPAYVPLEVRDL